MSVSMEQSGRRRACVALLAALLATAAVAGAEPADRTTEPQTEEIIVTGSRIPRPDFQSASPIVSLLTEDFERSGALTVESVLNNLPQFVPSVTATSNSEGNGQANVDLRGLGPQRTLVLVDGRRMVPANGNGVPDLNIIPPGLIERVEVISGGASAVYGSDALAGVVNLRLKSHYEGVELGGRWGQTDQGDAEQYDVSLLAGTSFADGRGSIVGFAGYSEREQLDRGARDYARYALTYIGPGLGLTGPGNAFVRGGTGVIEEGLAVGLFADPGAFNGLFESYGYARGSVPYSPRFGFNADGTLFTPGNGRPNSVANFRGTVDSALDNGGRFYFYNFSPGIPLLLPLERESLFTAGSFDLSESVELYAQALYADYSANTQAAPVPLQDVSMPASNPFIPADLKQLLDARANPDAPLNFVKRMTELGPRIQDNQSDTWQLVTGARGSVFGDWHFDVYFQHGESDQTKDQTGNIRRTKVLELTYAADGGLAACGGFNPFGIGKLPAACADYVSVDSQSVATVEESIAEASLRGALLQLPAGELQAAFGLMYRDNRYHFRADDLLRQFLPDGYPDVYGFEAADNIDGDDDNLDVYAEFLAPLLANLPGVQSLDVVAGFRHSDYASAGGTDSWKAELLYAPIEMLRLRGSYQRAVRAASVYELYQPQLPADAEVDIRDPCSVNSRQRRGADAAQVEALCVAQGIPASLLPVYRSERGFIAKGVAGGNPDLEPETADTYTLGVVLSSPFENPLWSGLHVSLDWYRIEIEDVIDYLTANEYVPNCYDPAFNPAYSAENHWCTNFSRSATTGEIEHTIEIYRNLARLEASGVDMQLDWRIDAGPGQLGLSWFVGWTDSHEQQSSDESPGVEQAGTVGGFAGAYPDWKWQLALSYDVHGLDLTGQWHHIDGMRDFYFPGYSVGDTDYFDLYASYAIEAGELAGLSLRLGVENVADHDPPIIASWANANTDASQYDVLGRRYFLSLRYALP